MSILVGICIVNMTESIYFFTVTLYHRLSLYFPPTESDSSADSLWWLFNQDDKQLKTKIRIGGSDDKTLTKHAPFCIFEKENKSFPHRKSLN